MVIFHRIVEDLQEYSTETFDTRGLFQAHKALLSPPEFSRNVPLLHQRPSFLYIINISGLNKIKHCVKMLCLIWINCKQESLFNRDKTEKYSYI